MAPLGDPVAPKIFISRAAADGALAGVVGEIARDAGYDVILQQWDFANRNFMERMHAALAGDTRVVALLSPEYLRSEHCQAEWQNALARDPLNLNSRVVLLRVAECEPIGLLAALAYWDVVPVAHDRAMLRDLVLDALREGPRDAAAGGLYWRSPRALVEGSIRPVPGFGGREGELVALSDALAGDDAMAAVCGLGGVGKSSVAREYAWRNRGQYSVVWWLSAQTEDTIVEGLLRLGAFFVRGLDRLANRRAAAQQVIGSVLSGFEKPVLFVFDNLEDERLARAWRPRSNAHTLLTSRNLAWSGDDITAIALHPWSIDIAIEYLQRESRRDDLSETDARAIVHALGALPLALAHAAASLRGMRMVAPRRYLERIVEHLRSAPRGAEYPQSVFATFSTSIAQAEKEAEGAGAVLCFAASFAPDAIPDELFRQRIDSYPSDLGPIIANELRLDEALGALDRLSLLTFSQTSRTYGIHRLVQLAARDMAGSRTVAWREGAITVADAAFPRVEFERWPQCERLLSHARTALDALPPEAQTFLPAARLAGRCGAYLRDRGDYVAAELLLERALSIFEKTFGSEDSVVADALHQLAILRWRQGRYDEAEPLHTRALAILEKALGSEHLDVASTLSSLGTLYNQQGRYAEAEPLCIRALAIREKALGPDHGDVANTVNNLAILYCEQGRFAEGEPLQKRALAIREAALGPDHPHVANSLSNLAEAYRLQARYDEAEPLLARGVAIYEKALGSEHPDVAFALSNLGILYYDQGRYEEAEPLLKRALAIREKALAPGHADVAFALTALARLYEARERFEEAETLQTRALAIRREALGPNHSLTIKVREELGALRSRRATGTVI
jgi:tetratricopeptide (TPR) repeat protein